MERKIYKKHPRSYEENAESSYEHGGKRMKLDNLLLELSLNDEGRNQKNRRTTHAFIEDKVTKKSQETDYVVNPSISLKPYSIFKKSSSPTTPTTYPSVNSYVVEKLVQHFHTIYNSKSALILWYNPHFLLIYHFEVWVLRLFNRFIRKYNKRSESKPIGKFKFYSKIMNLVHLDHVQFSYDDLLHILDQETKLEAIHLKEKSDARKNDTKSKLSKSSTKDDKHFENIKYDYWDTLRDTNSEVDMADAQSIDEDAQVYGSKIFEIREKSLSCKHTEDSDIEME